MWNFRIIFKNKNLYNQNKLVNSLNLLKNRGPDSQNYIEYENNNYKYFFLVTQDYPF